MQTIQQNVTSSVIRPHFQLLDGLRGVAAIAVLVFHFMEFAVPDYNRSFIAHGYLAVDFFFCLSGFVIAYAYDGKLDTIGIWTFLKLRIIRLQPLVIIGSVLGLISFLADPYRNFYSTLGLRKTVWMFINSCLMIPYPVLPQRYHNLFHLNPPTWSLMWEYVASLAYALVLVKFPKKLLWVATGLAALTLVYAAHRFMSLGIGWSAENALGGGVRVGFSFLAGLLLYRSGWLIRSRLGFVPIAALLLAIFMMPYRKGLNPITESAVVIVAFPVLIALAAATPLSKAGQSVSKLLGDISYPLYMIHYPFLWILLSYIETQKPTVDQLRWIMPLMGAGLLVFAWLTMAYVDRPIRKWLTTRFVKARK